MFYAYCKIKGLSMCLNVNILLGPLYLVWTSDCGWTSSFTSWNHGPRLFEWLILVGKYSEQYIWKYSVMVWSEQLYRTSCWFKRLLLWYRQSIVYKSTGYDTVGCVCVALSQLLIWEKKLVLINLCMTCIPWE